MIQEFNKNWKEPEGGSDSESGSESGSESETGSEEKKKKQPAKKAQSAKPKEKEKKEKKEKVQREKKEKNSKTSTDRESRKERKIKDKEERKSSVTRSPQKKLKTEKDTASISGTCVKSEYGSFEQGDKPKKLLAGRSGVAGITFTVEWQPRKDGTVPKKSLVTNNDLKKNHKDMLLDYYEERLKFVKPASSRPTTVDKSEGSKPATVDKPASDRLGNNESSEAEKSQQSMNIESTPKPNDAIEEEKEAVKNNDNNNMEVEKEGQGEPQAPVQTPGQAELEPENKEKEPENKEKEPETPREEIVENGKQQEELGSADLIQNQGQMIFADVGTNNVQEIRDLTLDANLMVYDQAEKVNKDAEAEAKTEAESLKDPNKIIEEALEVKGLEA